MKYGYLPVLAVALASCTVIPSEPLYYDLVSPDKKIDLRIEIDSTLSISMYDGKNCVAEMPDISMTLADGTVWGCSAGGDMLPLKDVRYRSVDKSVKSPLWWNPTVVERYNQANLVFDDFGVRIRAYDDGFAYQFYSRTGEEYTVTDENAEFILHASDTRIGESNVRSYPGLQLEETGEGRFHAVFPDTVAVCRGKRDFPWRAVAYGDYADLYQGKLFYLLGDKPRKNKSSWIVSGEGLCDSLVAKCSAGELECNIQKVMDRFVSAGMKGVAVEGLDMRNQKSSELVYSVCEAAYRSRLLLYFLDMDDVSGIQRTYPNVIGAGRYNAESETFARKMARPILNCSAKPFDAADSIAVIPAFFDSSRVLDVCDASVVMRVRDDVRYIGGAAREGACSYVFDFSYVLSPGEECDALIIRDAAGESAADGCGYVTERIRVTSDTQKRIDMEPEGGFVIIM